MFQTYGEAFGDQGALFEKTAPWTPAKTFHTRSTIVLRFIKVFPIGTILFLLFFVSSFPNFLLPTPLPLCSLCPLWVLCG
jgi:hypothetical protein